MNLISLTEGFFKAKFENLQYLRFIERLRAQLTCCSTKEPLAIITIGNKQTEVILESYVRNHSNSYVDIALLALNSEPKRT